MEENRKPRINLEERLEEFLSMNIENKEEQSTEGIFGFIDDFINEIETILIDEIDDLDRRDIILLTRVSIIVKTWARVTSQTIEDLYDIEESL